MGKCQCTETGPLQDFQIILIYFIFHRLLFYFREQNQIEIIKFLSAEVSDFFFGDNHVGPHLQCGSEVKLKPCNSDWDLNPQASS